MTIVDAIIDRLINTAEIALLVGDRWYPDDDSAPQKPTEPYGLVYVDGDTDPHHNMDGSAGLVESDVSVDVYATTRDKADTIAALVKAALDGYKGTATIAGETLVIQQCHYHGSERDSIWLDDGGDKRLRVESLRFQTFYEE
jgi:hypothetical protein